MPGTIKDIARQAGISFQAVSAVLNGNLSKTSEITRRRVFAAASELNYRPNRLARGLAGRKTGLVAFVAPDFNSPYYADLNQKLRDEADRHERQLMVFASRWDVEETCAKVAQAADYVVDGVLLVQNVALEIRKRGLLPAGTPMVVMSSDGAPPGPEDFQIRFDYLPGMRQVFAMLLERGCRNIELVHCLSERPKLSAFRRVCAENGMEPRVRQFPFCNNDDIVPVFARELASESLPDAFLASADYISVGMVREFAALGIRVPDDVSLVSIDDAMISQYITPALCTIRLDRSLVARTAFNMLINPSHERTTVIGTELVMRDSVR